MKRQHAVLSGLLASVALLGGCASMDSERERHPGPDGRLTRMLQADATLRDRGSDCHDWWGERGQTVDCERIHREIDRLYAEYPAHARVTLANAVLHYESGRRETAQFLLDQLLEQPAAFPEAAILRARIALTEGNTTRARHVLEQQTSLAPDHAELREALASAYFLEGQYDEADNQLRIALILGAPGWRADYHRGLILEAQGQPRLACEAFDSALQRRQDFPAALSRLIGLSADVGCEERLRRHFPQRRPRPDYDSHTDRFQFP